jgi:hypothetical protein
MSPKEPRERWAIVGLGVALAWGAASWGADAPTPSARTAIATVYQRNRSFRIPFSVPEDERPRRKEMQLWMSEDSGGSWTLADRASPDQTSFTFRSSRDGEYWFTVLTLDDRGRHYPDNREQLKPRIKVVVDTVPPDLALEAGDRTGSQATVRWRVRDSHLDLSTLALETQVDDETRWHPVAIQSPSPIGGETWDPGTSKPITVRVSAADKAGNRIETVLSLPKISPSDPRPDPGALKPTERSLAGSEPGEPARQAPEPLKIRLSVTDQDGNRSETVLKAPVDSRIMPGRFSEAEPRIAISQPDLPAPGQEKPIEPTPRPLEPGIVPPPGPVATETEPEAIPPVDRRAGLDPAVREAAVPPTVPDANRPARAPLQPGSAATRPLRVTGPRFELPSRDDGRGWKWYMLDLDRKPPFQVELNAEGMFGFWLVARDANGEGDRTPTAGDRPQLWVKVRFDPNRNRSGLR